VSEVPTPVVALVPGTVVAVGEVLGVNVNGSTPPVWWPAGYIPTVGDAVKVLMVNGTAVVHSPVIVGQRPLTGTASGSASGGFVNVVTSAGTIACRYTGSAPANGTLVRLDWQSTTPWVWPSAASAPPAPVLPITPPTPEPPPVTTTGTHIVTAGDSGSWSPQGWSAFHGTDLTQGAYGGGSSYTGAWFYGATPQQILGATVTRFQLRLGARRRLGSYNADTSLNVYLTSDVNRPAGDTTRVAGPWAIALGVDAGPQWVELPPGWGQALVVNGGGIAIAGNPYAGVVGIGGDPESGQLAFDWSL
jgi:hypothetical protein